MNIYVFQKLKHFTKNEISEDYFFPLVTCHTFAHILTLQTAYTFFPKSFESKIET